MGDILNVNLTCSREQEQWIDTSNFLQKDLYLGEYSNEFPGPNGETIDEKALVRNNLEIYSKDEIDDLIDIRIEEEIEEHSNANDPHGDRNYTDNKLTLYYKKSEIDNSKFVKLDGTIPFTSPQKGVNPTLPYHLATKNYVDRVAIPKLLEYLNSSEFINFIDLFIENYSNEYLPEKIILLREEILTLLDIITSEQNNTDLVVSESLNDLNSRILNLRELLNSTINDTISNLSSTLELSILEINTNINNKDLVVSASLNNLNTRINDLNQIFLNNINTRINELLEAIDSELTTSIEEILSLINNNELTISNALNNLDERVIELTELVNTPKKVNQIKINGKILFEDFDNKDYKLLELISESKLYHIILLFTQYSSVNITLSAHGSTTFGIIINFDNTDYIYAKYNYDNNTVNIVKYGDSNIINNFNIISSPLIQDFLETIDIITYTTYFYEQ